MGWERRENLPLYDNFPQYGTSSLQSKVLTVDMTHTLNLWSKNFADQVQSVKNEKKKLRHEISRDTVHLGNLGDSTGPPGMGE